MTDSLIKRDLAHLFHPCSQMKDYQNFPPLVIEKAEGALLYSTDGREVIDAISSWWCKSLGHRHPALLKALQTQAAQFEHVILANTTNETIVKLTERLASLKPSLNKVFYASDGSCAVEIALKLALNAQALRGHPERRYFASLQNGYHGETALTLSVSDLGLYRQPFASILTPCHSISGIPSVSGENDPLWSDCSAMWPQIENSLNPIASTLAAIIVEPLVQGAGNMRIYSMDALRRLHQWAREHDVLFIADEIMTGFGRTGYPLACDIPAITPDLLCLGKGLTGGVLPMSAVLIDEAIYDLFYADYGTGHDFLHSHTYCGNALAAAVANACLDVYETENIFSQVRQNSAYLLESMQVVAEETGCLRDLRHLGYIVAADLTDDTPRAGYKVYQKALALGALLRPIGNTIYWLPPLNTPRAIIDRLRDITIEAILTA